MSTYPQRVADNILPLSISNTLPEAFKEWYFTENVEDHEDANQDCGLCNHEELRYLFEIKNQQTQHTLWVGSSCILKFQLRVFDKNKYLTPKFAFVVFWRLTSNRIDHTPSFFKVNLRKNKYKKDLASMETSRVHMIWPALTSSQRQLAIEYGHTEPDKK